MSSSFLAETATPLGGDSGTLCQQVTKKALWFDSTASREPFAAGSLGREAGRPPPRGLREWAACGLRADQWLHGACLAPQRLWLYLAFGYLLSSGEWASRGLHSIFTDCQASQVHPGALQLPATLLTPLVHSPSAPSSDLEAERDHHGPLTPLWSPS